MRAQLATERKFKRFAALALCVLGAAVLSGCETYQDARDTSRDFYPRLPSASYYTVIVHNGDSVSAIAARYDTSSEQVMRMNDLSRGDVIHPGQALRVPAARGTRGAVFREATNNRLPPAPDYTPDKRIIVRETADLTPRRRPVTPTHVERARVEPASHVDAPQNTNSSQRDARLGDPLTSGFVVPVSGKIIAGFGSTGGGQRNDGINIAAADGTPFHAAADGVVSYAGNELKGYGNLILIKHGDDYVTAYAHANSIGVARGQRVSKGDVIGTVGQTGDVKQPQLHFEIRRDMKPIDPRPILTASTDS